jgi:hypothetical protein
MNTPATAAAVPAAGTPEELFALSDEQILEIEPEPIGSGTVGQPLLAVRERTGEATPREDQLHPGAQHENPAAAHDTDKTAQAKVPVLPQPPPWLAAQMKDPWSGEDAREFWNGVQQARTEAAAYRAAIASPEDARALKELYPGGLAEARAAADRARVLEEIDRAYFGGAGNSPEQLSASRAQLAQRMFHEDPAAFREMVIAGLRVLEEAEKGSSASASPDLPRLAKLFAQGSRDVNVAQPLRAASSAEASAASNAAVVAQHSFDSAQDRAAPLQGNIAGPVTPARQALHESPVTSHESLSAYAAFERAANEDLERSVGSAIQRTLEQALPVAQPLLAVRGVNVQAKAPALHARLSAAIRQDVEHALQGDRQLGEQIAQILASRRFDTDTRTQVVRLINERAQQLVPGAAKRVLNEWTQTRSNQRQRAHESMVYVRQRYPD